MKLAALLSVAVAAAPMAHADCTADAMLVFDGSASMADIGLDPVHPTRIDDARAAVSRVMPQVEDARRIGLMTYGPGGETGCSGLEIAFTPQPSAAAATIARIEALEPEGRTPLTSAVEIAADILNYESEPAVIVVVTDGNETCGGRPCDVAGRLASRARDLTVHVIGFRGQGTIFFWQDRSTPRFANATSVRCFPDRTDGLFVTTQTVNDLVRALRQTLGCNLNAALPSALPHRPT